MKYYGTINERYKQEIRKRERKNLNIILQAAIWKVKNKKHIRVNFRYCLTAEALNNYISRIEELTKGSFHQ